MKTFYQIASVIGFGLILLFITSILSWCSLKSIRNWHKFLIMLKTLPENLQIMYEENAAYAFFSRTINDKKEIKKIQLWTGFISWENGTRPVQVIKKSAETKLRRRHYVFWGLVIPLFACSIVLGYLLHPIFYTAAPLIAIEQVFPFIIGPDLLEIIQDSL